MLTQLKVTSYICRQAVVYHDQYFYVFGGVAGGVGDMSKIGRLDTNLLWSVAGEMMALRRAHNVVFNDNGFLIIGGRNYLDKENDHSRPTEKCIIQNDTISCTTQAPTLTYYEYYPELFLVPETFCKDFPQ